MSKDDSREIRKMFYEDVAKKKRIGSNVFRRTGKGSPYAGVPGGVRFSQKKYKPYEKNSKVETVNIYNQILSIDKFNEYDKENQREMMISWLIKYSRSMIAEKMGINWYKLTNLINSLNIREEDYLPINEYDLNEFKDGEITLQQFKSLTNIDKYKLLEHYNKTLKIKNKDIADMLGISINTLNTYKSQWKNEYEKESSKMNEMPFMGAVIGIDDSNNDDRTVNNAKKVKRNKDKNKDSLESYAGGHSSKSNMFNQTDITISSNDIAGREVRDKLATLLLLIKDENRYSINIDIVKR